MEIATVTRKHIGGCVPSMGGVGGFIVQDDITVITTARGSRIVVTGTRSEMGGCDVTAEAPAGDHTAIVAYWQAEATRWAAEAAHLATPDTVVVEGELITAPGFDELTFAQSLVRARRDGAMPMIPAGAGVVVVESVRTGERYEVTRSECSCQGGRLHGRWKHRTAVLCSNDVAGLDMCRVHVLGFNPTGWPVTAAARREQLGRAA